MTDSPMVLLFPQYQAGYVPSHIPIGMASLKSLWERAPGFVRVPLQETDDENPETDRLIRFRRVIRRQMEDAQTLIRRAAPDFILTTGGDCGASFASIAYLNEHYKGKIGVIWVDAHGDLHLPSTSPSGNYHGMILRHLMGDAEFDMKPVLPLATHQIAYLGLRDTEDEEDAFIEAAGIPRFGAEDVMAGNAPLDAVIHHFKKHGLSHIHLHVDCDVMDEKVFPFVEVPEAGGLTLERLLEVLQYLRAQMPLSGCCLTEYAPRIEGDGLDIIKRIYTEGLGMTLPT